MDERSRVLAERTKIQKKKKIEEEEEPPQNDINDKTVPSCPSNRPNKRRTKKETKSNKIEEEAERVFVERIIRKKPTNDSSP